MALRRELGAVRRDRCPAKAATSGSDVQTSATGSPYRWTSVAVDRSFGQQLAVGSASAGSTRSRPLLGGRMSDALGGGGSTSMFLDVEARRELGSGFSAGPDRAARLDRFRRRQVRRPRAYGFDLTKLGVLERQRSARLPRFRSRCGSKAAASTLLLPTSLRLCDAASATSSLAALSR